MRSGMASFMTHHANRLGLWFWECVMRGYCPEAAMSRLSQQYRNDE